MCILYSRLHLNWLEYQWNAELSMNEHYLKISIQFHIFRGPDIRLKKILIGQSTVRYLGNIMKDCTVISASQGTISIEQIFALFCSKIKYHMQYNKLQEANIYIFEMHNLLFPGTITGPCYFKRKKPLTVFEYTEHLKKFIGNILSMFPKIKIFILPGFYGRRLSKCYPSCMQCIAYPRAIEKMIELNQYILRELNMEHEEWSNVKVLRIESIVYLLKNMLEDDLTSFQVLEVNTQRILHCSTCFREGLYGDNVHPCCLKSYKFLANLCTCIMDQWK